MALFLHMAKLDRVVGLGIEEMRNLIRSNFEGCLMFFFCYKGCLMLLNNTEFFKLYSILDKLEAKEFLTYPTTS